MDLKQYQVEAMRTRSVSTLEDQIHNAAHGIAGEVGEVTLELERPWHLARQPDKLAAELGDVMWYLAELADAYKFELSDLHIDSFPILHPPYHEILVNLLTTQGAINEYVKKTLHHHKVIDKSALYKPVSMLLWTLIQIAERRANMTLGAVMDANIAKLLVRHPNGPAYTFSLAKVRLMP